jgi:hypothetical protein
MASQARVGLIVTATFALRDAARAVEQESTTEPGES